MRRRKWSMLAVFIAVVAVGAWLVLSEPVSYRSYASFLIEESARGAGGSPALSVLERLGQANTVETEMEILGSRRVLEPAVSRLGLHVAVWDSDGFRRAASVFSDFRAEAHAVPGVYLLEPRADGGFRVVEEASGEVAAEGSWGEQVSFAGLVLRPTEEEVRGRPSIHVQPLASAVQGLRGQIETRTPSRDAAVIQLVCAAPRPEAAADVCSAVSETYLELRAALQRAEATAAEEFLTDQVSRIEDRLTAAEESLKAYARRHRVVALQAQAEGEASRFADIRARRDLMESELGALERLMEALESSDAESREYRNLASFPTFITGQNHMVSGMVQRLVDLENQRAELALRRTDTNPDMVALDERIAEIENQLKSTTEAYARALRSQITSLDGTLGEMGQNLARIPEQQVESARLQRQVSLLEDLYRFLQTRLREAEVAQAVNLPSVRVIDEASFPTSPTGSNRRVGFGLALLAGFAAAFVTGVVQEYLDTRLREPYEVERRTGLPVLGVVPALNAGLGAAFRRNGGRSAARLTAGGQERQAAAEAFRSLVLELKFAGEDLQSGDLRLVAVTSAARGEGKTFTACNLAFTAALQGTRTLLVDADLRAMGTSRMLGLREPKMGLSDVLEGRGEPRDAVVEFELTGGVLHVLPAGKHRTGSAGLLSSDRLGDVVNELRDGFDLVVVDTPPLNVISDAATISSRVDGVIVVVRGGMTERAALELTLNRLQRARARIAGIVVNDVRLPDYYYTPYGE